MIGYIEGKVIKVAQDGILLLAGHVGYDILLPVVTLEKLASDLLDENLSLHIYYHQTERQPKPVLIGFQSEEEKAFFQQFITVDAIGPLKAVKAMEQPVERIARAIEGNDTAFLSALKGIGKRTAQKIVATLHGKVSQFLVGGGSDGDGMIPIDAMTENTGGVGTGHIPVALKGMSQQVVDVLVEQLGYTSAVARRMVTIALEKNNAIDTPEALFDAVLKER